MFPPLPFLDTSKAVALEHQMSRVHLESSRIASHLIKEEAKQILGQGPARPLGAVRNLYTKIGTSIKAMGQPPRSSLSPSPSPFYQPDSQGQCLRTGEFYPLKQASGFLEKQQFSNMICLYTLASSGQTVPPTTPCSR